ncbi:MAG: 4-hydroxythreonine-4-phosphate dehydrogenase PdxA [Kiritimatiellia bacterium]|nr:4-hydroxythreonine-4-phosphate dehydrogenase PdxA [Kiritimatiellia bacterium]MDP6631258.1 4-hydroxythreonine-4-phosphate dehydrogenase PdxA [Kiritimatiellia bacterium]MDP6809589.1 4-hydroxythreonine-4-phosphate dehydrogenase PdxA [Kiritimatiellia bacterium]MDP7023560.1 4-hydroxythreonine-4-phosphate dehydrogenase PdxA [Kiritimatiellia bacterium]
MKPRIAITMGDPAGVGPELCLRALAEASLQDVAAPVVFGNFALLQRVSQACGLPLPALVLTDVTQVTTAAGPAILDLPGLPGDAVTPGSVDASTGLAAYHCITAAIDAALNGAVDGICTAPIHKEALQAAGISHPGHTEILSERTGAERICMMLTSEQITVSLVTTHLGLCDVPAALDTGRVRETIDLTADAMRRLRGHEPHLVVCGLNPHAGEGGLFGRNEEANIILPAIEAARADGLHIEGPLPPDTAFLPERLQATDATICMYHDQGLIPLKMLAFDRAVNVTLGLPIVRTSVDHGTALDLAWQGKARPGSMFEAVRLAARLSQ